MNQVASRRAEGNQTTRFQNGEEGTCPNCGTKVLLNYVEINGRCPECFQPLGKEFLPESTQGQTTQ